MINKSRHNIAVVGSTLPIPAIDAMFVRWGITNIFVIGNELTSSYRFLCQKHEQLTVHTIPSMPIFQLWYLTGVMLRAKFTGAKVYFFHECCMLVFDLLIGLFKPKSFYYPQVTMDSFEPICMKSNLPRKYFLLRLFKLHKSFALYKTEGDNLGAPLYAISRLYYPKNTKVFPVSASSNFRYSNGLNTGEQDDTADALIIGGSDVVENEQLINIYVSLIDILSSSKREIHYKDHPNPRARLNLKDSRLTYLDPFMPAELVQFEYKFVIGFASTSLLAFGAKAISIANLLDCDADLIAMRIRHLMSLPGGTDIVFPKDMSKLQELLNSAPLKEQI